MEPVEGIRPASLRPFFAPDTVAVVGAGRSRGQIGAEIFHNLLAGGFRGKALPVNPRAAQIESVPAYASVRDIPGPVDLAVIAVPAAAVEAVVDDCIAKNVPAIVIISAGFGETGERGRAAEARLRDKVRRAGLRLIGPNCMGVVNTDPATHLNASFSPVFPPAGPIGFSSQSGALGLAILERAQQLNLGIASFVSVGNRADVSSNDLIEYWAEDPRISVILLYLESFGNPRRFGGIARRVARQKPIVAVKAGRSRSGARAASSHTGALAASDTMVDALFRDAGVIRTSTLEELFDVAALLSHQPLPAGPRVAVLTNAGGPGIMAADACEALGLSLPPLQPSTLAALRAFLPAEAAVANPIDMIATASADHYRRAMALLLADPGIDSLVAIFIPPLVTSALEVATVIAGAAHGSAKPVLAAFFGAAGVRRTLGHVPCYDFPESAARALAHVVWYSRWRQRPPGNRPSLSRFDARAARALVEARHRAGGGWLTPLDSWTLLDACGIRAVPTLRVATGDEAVTAARRVGYPVVLKGSGPDIVHKTEAHAIFVGLEDDAQLLRAFHTLEAEPAVSEVYLQPMVEQGIEMLVGATFDQVFGHVIVCGTGGTRVELLQDTACRLAPVTDVTAAEMLNEIRGIALLRGFRGTPIADEAGLLDVALRVSELVTECADIVELDLNPVIVTPRQACVVDARVRVRPTDPTGPR